MPRQSAANSRGVKPLLQPARRLVRLRRIGPYRDDRDDRRCHSASALSPTRLHDPPASAGGQLH